MWQMDKHALHRDGITNKSNEKEPHVHIRSENHPPKKDEDETTTPIKIATFVNKSPGPVKRQLS